MYYCRVTNTLSQNNCFFQFFTNKCNSDNPACECTLNDMREKYFCCVAKNCLNYVAYGTLPHPRLPNEKRFNV